MEVLSADKWLLCLDSKGRILDQYTIRKIAFHVVKRAYSKKIELMVLKLDSAVLCYIQKYAYNIDEAVSITGDIR